MKSIHFIALLFAAFCTCRGGSGEWNYTDQYAWKNVQGWYCFGAHQSPINIRTSNVFITKLQID